MLFIRNVHVSLFHDFLSFFVFFIGNKIMFRLKFIFEYISTYKFTQKFHVFFIGESCHFSSAENNRFHFLFSWNYWPRFKRPASDKKIKNQKSKLNRVVVALHTLSNFVIIVNWKLGAVPQQIFGKIFFFSVENKDRRKLSKRRRLCFKF